MPWEPRVWRHGPGYLLSKTTLSRWMGRDAVRVVLASEHASPLAAMSGVNAGGQHVHVAELASGLVRLGHSVAVYTRRNDHELTEWVTTSAGYELIQGADRTGGPDLRG